jgi:hypothetical protein
MDILQDNSVDPNWRGWYEAGSRGRSVSPINLVKLIYQVHLHDRLLLSLLHNASAPTALPIQTPLHRKRKKLETDHPDFDIDENLIEPKSRVQRWISGFANRDIARIRRVMLESEEEAGGEDDGTGRRGMTNTSKSHIRSC